MLLKESGLLPDRLAPLLGRLPGADLTPDTLNTQEQAWAVAAAAALGRDGRPARVAVNGRAAAAGAAGSQVALTGPATARNLGEAPVWQTVSRHRHPRRAAPGRARRDAGQPQVLRPRRRRR